MATVTVSTLLKSNRMQNSNAFITLSALKTYCPLVVSRITRIGPVVVFWFVTKSCMLVITVCLCRQQWPRGLSRGSAASRLLGLRLRIPPRAWMFVCCECRVCSQVEVSAAGSSLVQRSPTECGLCECDLETSTMRSARCTGSVGT
jgi:hypothetical protein